MKTEWTWEQWGWCISLWILSIGFSILLAQAPGCTVSIEQERTKRYRPVVIVQPCGEVLNDINHE